MRCSLPRAATAAILSAGLLLGCAPRGRIAPDLAAPTADEGGATLAAFGPGVWEGHGIRLDIPPDFTGTPGPPDGALVLTVHHDDSDVRLELWVYARTAATVSIRPRTGCEAVFADGVGTPRTVPGLDVQQVATCIHAAGIGGVVHGWYGWLAGQEVHVEAVYPDGRAVEGRLRVQPLLSSLRAATP